MQSAMMIRRVSVATLLILAACHVRPKRFSDLTIVPAPPSRINREELKRMVNPGYASDVEALLQGILDRYEHAYQYEKRPFHAGGFKNKGLFDNTAEYHEILTAGVFSTPAPPPSPETQSSFYLRSAERAQAEVVRNFFARLPPTTSAADAIDSLAKKLADTKKDPKADSPGQPRVQLTMSHLLALPGEWERVQYFAIFLVLHSADVKFADTNEFESVLRDIDLGTLSQTAVSGITATGSTGIGEPIISGTTVSRPGSASITPTLSYTEALNRSLKEQLQLRASSITDDGRVFAIVLKSSQTNKLPTLARQIVTMQYRASEIQKGRLVKASYKAGDLASLSFADQVIRQSDAMGMEDRNANDSLEFVTKATPIVIAVVRRVTNAAGVNTSLEDDDRVQYVTQAMTGKPVVLDRTPKCEFEIQLDARDAPKSQLAILAPQADDPKPAVFDSLDDVTRFIQAIKARIRAAGPDVLRTGLVFESKDLTELQGYRVTYGPADSIDPGALLHQDWSNVDAGSLGSVSHCRQ